MSILGILARRRAYLSGFFVVMCGGTAVVPGSASAHAKFFAHPEAGVHFSWQVALAPRNLVIILTAVALGLASRAIARRVYPGSTVF